MKCSECNGYLQGPSSHREDDFPFIPVYCPICQTVQMIDAKTNEAVYVELVEDVKIDVDIPPLRLGTQVYINNKEHILFLEQGKIIKRDHKHYRIRMVSTNKKLHGTCLWVPCHWIKEFPKF